MLWSFTNTTAGDEQRKPGTHTEADNPRDINWLYASKIAPLVEFQKSPKKKKHHRCKLSFTK